MGKRKELSHEELWDDSALIRSWDEALQEYNLYHSIHARGERVEDILREVENQQSDSYNASTNNHGDHEHMNGDSAPQNGKSGAENSQVPEDERVQETPQQSADNTMPQLAGNSGRMAGADPLLKNLMMSWYYAGYYSGLYEGQKDISNDPMQHQNATGTGVDEKNGSGT